MSKVGMILLYESTDLGELDMGRTASHHHRSLCLYVKCLDLFEMDGQLYIPAAHRE